jgi:hypothetical protein
MGSSCQFISEPHKRNDCLGVRNLSLAEHFNDPGPGKCTYPDTLTLRLDAAARVGAAGRIWFEPPGSPVCGGFACRREQASLTASCPSSVWWE